MLAAHHRLRRSDDFRRAIRGGRRSSRPTMVVHALPANSAPVVHRLDDGTEGGREPARVGFVVSRAVGGSVVRNRVTRRLRHLMAQRLDALDPGTLVVVRANPRAATASARTLADDLDACLGSVGGVRTTVPTGHRASRGSQP